MSEDRRRTDPRVEPPQLPARTGYVTRAEFDNTIASLRDEIIASGEKPPQHPYRSLPPMRDAMDTNSFRLNVRDLEAALEVEREKFRVYEKAKMQEQIIELKSTNAQRVTYALKLIGAVFTILATAFVGWLFGKAK